jgi:hypothetical protein
MRQHHLSIVATACVFLAGAYRRLAWALEGIPPDSHFRDCLLPRSREVYAACRRNASAILRASYGHPEDPGGQTLHRYALGTGSSPVDLSIRAAADREPQCWMRSTVAFDSTRVA